ncbi:Hypothetical protein SRAE_1000000500 [Strongyloides ratti]|uniref:Uncharacterized protein n=1 Tax=Strongyloides ratti TaxID=34506 RepID=A0A090L0V8_STRRB|nr:Hypothetical protein SRAE_1000000500 [Strongyloides ratti]CEF61727.1 Hypothetical protein SRAE_1000000500 [Strongyloides ratti]
MNYLIILILILKTFVIYSISIFNQQGLFDFNNDYYNNNFYNQPLINTRGLYFKRGFVPLNQMKIGEAYGDDLTQFWLICHDCPK